MDTEHTKPIRKRKGRYTYRPVHDFDLKLLHLGLTRKILANEAQVGESTVHSMLNPGNHADRKGYVSTAVATKLGAAYARHANVSDGEGLAQLFEHDENA